MDLKIMARNKKYPGDITIVTSQRYPKKILDSKPTKYITMADWHIDCLNGHVEVLNPKVDQEKAELSADQKAALTYFYSFFSRMLAEGSMDAEISDHPEILTHAEHFEGLIKHE